MFTRFLARLGRLAPYVIPFLVGCFVGILWFRSAFHSVVDPEAKPVPFVVEKGENLKTVAKRLQDQGIINYWWSLYIPGRMRGGGTEEEKLNIQSGEYTLSASMSPLTILEKLQKAEILYHSITIPEGTRVAEIASLMAKTGLVIVPEAEEALHDKELMAKLQIPNSFEGFLFPDTYKFTRPITAREMVERMVQEEKKRITPDMYDRAIELNLSFPQILTLASIIEKETGRAEERAVVSSVFHNRLRIQMPLQSDPTVIYGIPDFNGNLTKEQLNTPSPYNTYLNSGLPPTPICNPGMETIKAALHPADTDYLYFVAKCDGTHYFSTTYKEHRAAVDLYQKQGCPGK